jgi:uncharacterized membrane protein YbhN (UPF0104 family)
MTNALNTKPRRGFYWLAGLALKIGISLAALFYAVRGIDIAGVPGQLSGLSIGLVTAAVAQLALQPFIHAWRWRIVLNGLGEKSQYLSTTRTTFIATFFNQALPATISGDAIRIWHAFRSGCTLRVATNSVLIDRVIMLAVLIFMAACANQWLIKQLDALDISWLVPLLSAGTFGGIVILMLADRTPMRWQEHVHFRFIADLAIDSRRVLLRLKYGMTLAVLSAISILNMVVTCFILARALGEHVAFTDILVLMPLVFLAGSLPITFAGWGIRESAMVALAPAVGLAPAAALVVSVLFGLASLLVSLPGVFFYLRGPLAKLRRGIEDSGDEESVRRSEMPLSDAGLEPDVNRQ